MRTPGRRLRWQLSGLFALAVATTFALPAGSAPLSPSLKTSPFIVQAPGDGVALSAVSTLVGPTRALGLIDLPLVHGVAANLTSVEVTQLKLTLTVSPDATVKTAMFGGKGVPAPRQLGNVFRKVTGALDAPAASYDGTNIGVAVVDTGIAPLTDFGNRLKDGVDYSGEGDEHHDSYGHGTFIAGLVGGAGSSNPD